MLGPIRRSHNLRTRLGMLLHLFCALSLHVEVKRKRSSSPLESVSFGATWMLFCSSVPLVTEAMDRFKGLGKAETVVLAVNGDRIFVQDAPLSTDYTPENVLFDDERLRLKYRSCLR